MPEFPTKLFFFCEVEPGSGGETPIVLSHLVYERMKAKFPEFVARLEEYGLIYTRVLGEGDDPSSPIGRGWQSTFLTKDRSVAEERFVVSFGYLHMDSNILTLSSVNLALALIECQCFFYHYCSHAIYEGRYPPIS